MESGGIQPDLGCSGSSPASHSWALDPQSHVVFSAKKGPGAGSLPATRVCWAGPRAQAVFSAPTSGLALWVGLKELPVSPSSMTHATKVALHVICRHPQTLV